MSSWKVFAINRISTRVPLVDFKFLGGLYTFKHKHPGQKGLLYIELYVLILVSAVVLALVLAAN